VLFFWGVNQLAGDPKVGASWAAWLLLAAGSLCVIPLAVLAGGRLHPGTSGAALLLFASVPSIVLFTPQTDHLILLTTMTAAAFAFEAVRRCSEPRALALAAAAGFVAGVALFVSLTSAAALGAWGIALAGNVALARDKVPTRRLIVLAAVAAAGLLAALAVPAVLGMNWPAVVRACFEGAHRVQVLIYERRYSTWVLWNLVDFVLFLGPPLALATIATWRSPFAVALLVAVVALDLSGSILGETGRIWMFLMPLAVLAAAGSDARRSDRALVHLAASQMLVLLAMRMVLRVPG
jgi:hypothetical protein